MKLYLSSRILWISNFIGITLTFQIHLVMPSEHMKYVDLQNWYLLIDLSFQKYNKFLLLFSARKLCMDKTKQDHITLLGNSLPLLTLWLYIKIYILLIHTKYVLVHFYFVQRSNWKSIHHKTVSIHLQSLIAHGCTAVTNYVIFNLFWI